MFSALALAALVVPSGVVPFQDFLVAGPFPSGGRTPCPVDPLAYQIVQGTFRAPKEGVETKGKTWKRATANSEGWCSSEALGGGYAFHVYKSEKDTTMTLDASGHAMVYVNGVPRGGDPYGFGYVQLPVPIKKGDNEFLFSVGRGRLRASLVPTVPGISVSNLDPTFPDVLIAGPGKLLCSVLLVNSTDKLQSGVLRGDLGGHRGTEQAYTLTPMTVRKVAFEARAPNVQAPGRVKLEVFLGTAAVPAQTFELEAKPSTVMHKRTFRSSVDGSVQYYAVQPASEPHAKSLVLSLHGASVEATSQAASYGQKPWCTIVCPTNGRPYGFDWEDWGRLNALETLADAKRVFAPDEDRVYLTGHSMGGHGTWSVGFNNPGRFAAIAPCAGWISFWSYGGAADWKDPDPVETLLRRAANSSDTLKLLDNSKNLGIFVLHGDADDNVPVGQAREMRQRLGTFHRDLDWHEEPGQGHWYDTDPEPGANVQDHPLLFDFFARRRIPRVEERRTWSVTTLNPDGDASAANLSIASQSKSMEPSRLTVRTWADGSYVEATTENVAALQVRPIGGAFGFKLKIDGQDVALGDGTTPVSLIKHESGWRLGSLEGIKRLNQEGGIKSVFGNNVVCVYGTSGKEAERDWAYIKARFDAETWWYRGNGSLELVPDSSWREEPGRNIVLYGNTRTNSVLSAIAKTNPFRKDSRSLSIVDRSVSGDVGMLWSGPAGDKLVGVIGGTTVKGCRAVERLPVFLSGVHFPDFYANSPEMLESASKGVVAAGFYGYDWSIDRGEFAFRNP